MSTGSLIDIHPKLSKFGAITVGVQLENEDRDRIEEGLAELDSLLATLTIPVKGRVIQRRQRLVAGSFLGLGKVDEIKKLAGELEAHMVVFDRELNAVQVRNLEKMTGLQVYDRTAVILEIFSQHARTNLAKTQVEIARLEYMLPRMAGAWTHFQRQKGGGFQSRGMGETQIEIDRRRARDRINRLQKQLEQIRQEKKTQSKSRRHELKVALVGYTNSGKTTIMNALTKSQFKAKDELFATLDASVRVIDPRSRPKILLSDTVGFIRNLPTSLIESFKSTLDHVLDADLLLHVVDASVTNYRDQVETTLNVLQDIGADKVPTIVVFNKIDTITDRFYAKILRNAYPNSIVVSAQNMEDILRLREHIYQYFENHLVRAHLRVPHENQKVIATILGRCKILATDYSDPEAIDFFVQGAKATLAKLSPFVVIEDARETTKVGSFEHTDRSTISP